MIIIFNFCKLISNIGNIEKRSTWCLQFTFIARTCMVSMFCHMLLQIISDIFACFTLVIRTFLASMFRHMVRHFTLGFCFKATIMKRMAFVFLQINCDICACCLAFTLIIRSFLFSMFHHMVREFTFVCCFKVTFITRT